MQLPHTAALAFGCWLLGWLLMASAAQATPFVPRDDAQVVEQLPSRLDAGTRAQRQRLAQAPGHLPSALALAQSALARARELGDARDVGLAQAALAPWWHLPQPPAAVRLLRATIRQNQHDFEAALGDLDALAQDAPGTPLPIQAQAVFTRAAVLQVTGQWVPAQADCTHLLTPRFASLGQALNLAAQACVAELRSLQGQGQAAQATLSALAAQAPQDAWLALVRAELAERLGDTNQAARLYAQAQSAQADVYTRAAHADFWLGQGQPAKALALVDCPSCEADALLLRKALALHQLRAPQAASVAASLQARFDAARSLGNNLHMREEARFALEVLQQPERALALARSNWAKQKEPADALLLARAARATQRLEATAGAAFAQALAVDVRVATAFHARPQALRAGAGL